MARVGMQDVELDEESADVVAAGREPGRRRLRWWVPALAGVVAMGVLGFQLVADARERAAVARLADVPGVLAPVDETLPVAWRSDSMGDLVWYQMATHGVVVGPFVDDDGSQHLVAHDLSTGEVRWSTELYGPDPARAEAEAGLGASPPVCVPTTDGPDPSQVACLASDGFIPYSSDGTTNVPATASFVRVVDTADGRVVAQWPTTGASLAVLDGVAVLASYTDSYGAVTLDGRDLLTGEPRWVAHVPAPTDVSPASVTDWPPNITRTADFVAYSDYYGRPAVFDADGRPVHPEIIERAGSGSPEGQLFVESVSGRLVLSSWSDVSGLSSSTILDGDGPGYTLQGSPYVPAVDDGSVPGLLLYSSADARRDGGTVLSGADVGTGDLRWKSDVGSSGDFTTAMILRGRAFAPTQKGLAAVDARSGRALWSVAAPDGTTFSTPMTDGRHLLVAVQNPEDGAVGELVALDPATGERVWQRELPDGVDYLYTVGDALLGLGVDDERHVREVVRIG